MFSINGFEACKPEYHPNYEYEEEKISEEGSKKIKLNNLKVLFSNKFEDEEES